MKVDHMNRRVSNNCCVFLRQWLPNDLSHPDYHSFFLSFSLSLSLSLSPLPFLPFDKKLLLVFPQPQPILDFFTVLNNISLCLVGVWNTNRVVFFLWLHVWLFPFLWTSYFFILSLLLKTFLTAQLHGMVFMISFRPQDICIQDTCNSLLCPWQHLVDF